MVERLSRNGMLTYPPEVVDHFTRRLLGLLEQQGLLSQQITSAFAKIPRHLFIERFYVQEGNLLRWNLRTQSDEDPRGWLEAIYANEPLVIRIDKDKRPSSSSSQPGVMAQMLQVLDVQPGQRVLEIGTGTGYNAALLARLVGNPRLVTSVEIDPELALHAQRTLDQVVGPGVTVHTGNGLDGYAPHALYDRIIATASYHYVPATWIHQLKPGGRLVMNLRGELSGGLLYLEKARGERDASGRFFDVGDVQFMALQDPTTHTDPLATDFKAYERRPLLERISLSQSVFDPHLLHERDFKFFLQWGFPQVQLKWQRSGNHRTTDIENYYPCLIERTSRTMMRLYPGERVGEWVAEVRGEQLLWSKLYHAYRLWLSLGRPTPSHYGIEIDSMGRQSIKIAVVPPDTALLPSWVIHT